MINIESVILRAGDLPTVDLGGEVGMMNVDTGKYYGLDPVGSRIWELIESPKAVSNIISELMSEYDVDENTCREHVISFLNHMYKEGLVRTKE